MFRRGTRKGFIGEMPKGGHVPPVSIVGAKLLWKNAQKKAKKKQISDTINSIIPYRRPLVTMMV